VAFLARKISRAKWSRRDTLKEGEIPADAVTSDLRTSDNALSFWKCGGGDVQDQERVVLALATAAQRLDVVDLVWLEESIFPDHEILLERSIGRTHLAEMATQHVDATCLDLSRLGILARQFDEALQRDQYVRFPARRVRDLVCEAIRRGAVDLEELESSLQSALKGYLSE